jgi:hemoglobin-like flavoprotein
MSLDLEALETSFDLVAPRGDELMDEFFSRLFATVPSAKPLFGTDLRRQKAMLLALLVFVRGSLRNLDASAPTLQRIGACNAVHGARPKHYPIVGQMLIVSMAAVADEQWKPEYEQAWSAAFAAVAAVMLQGAEQAKLEAAA